MEPIRVLIANDNAKQCAHYTAVLNAQPDIRVIYAAANGVDALQTIYRLHPQVVVCDMVMPQLDGFGLLEHVNRMEQSLQPAMIVLTALGRDDFVARAVQLGVRDYLVKPVEADLLAERIRVAARGQQTAPAAAEPIPVPHATTRSVFHRPPHQPDAPLTPMPNLPAAHPDLATANLAAHLLMQLGMPAHLSGYQYLVEAVSLTVHEPTMVSRVTRALYPAIAAHCDTTPARVERSIRNAIAAAWDRDGGSALNRILGRANAAPVPKPSNSELIATLATRIRTRGK